jgi:hypothetical protein
MNHKKHRADLAVRVPLDPYSSAAWFDGFVTGAAQLAVTLRDALPGDSIPVARPRTWLLRRGWRKRGLIAPEERPASR